MTTQNQEVKMVAVDAQLFESVGYAESTRQLYIKFINSPTLRFDNVPRFRHRGFMAAPRKDAYYNTFIKNSFLAKEVNPPPKG
jgi:hypothetical protein